MKSGQNKPKNTAKKENTKVTEFSLEETTQPSQNNS